MAITRQDLLDREAVRSKLVNKFWDIWRGVYLRHLPAVVSKFYGHGNLKKGSVVIIKEDNVPRMKWELGLVMQLFESKDGVVRSALVKTPNGQKTRAIQRLHCLEVVDKNVPEIDTLSEVADKNVPEIETLSEVVEENVPEIETLRTTRTGRIVKPVKRLDI
jgi:hypothetical protein